MESLLANFSLADWKDLSIIFQGVLMIFIVGTGAFQLHALREENKKNRTLEICAAWSRDPLIVEAARALNAVWINGELAKDPFKYRPYLITALNYFEDVAVGISQRVYNEDLVFEHLGYVLRVYKKRFLNDDFQKLINLRPTKNNYINLIALTEKWDRRSDADPIPPEKIQLPTSQNFAAT